MKHKLFSILALTLASLAAADSPQQQLTITAATPNVAIAPLVSGRQFLPLPDLEFHFLLEPRCSQGWTPLSMTLSIADSRTVLPASALDEHGFAETRLAIPAAQLAPLPLSGFCEIEDQPAGVAPTAGGLAELRFPGVVSLHAALICGNAEAERISYASRPLALNLECAPQATTGAEAPE